MTPSAVNSPINSVDLPRRGTTPHSRACRGGWAARLAAVGVAMAALTLMAAACAGPMSPPAAPPASTGQTPATQAGMAVPVTLTEFQIQMPPRNLAPGSYTFTATNRGNTVHALAIEGPGVAGERTPGVLQPGQSGTVTVTLSNGTYDFYCPVDGHKDAGMDLKVTVGGGAPMPSAPPSSTGGGSGYGY